MYLSLKAFLSTLVFMAVMMPTEGPRVDDRGQSSAVLRVAVHQAYAARGAFEDSMISFFEPASGLLEKTEDTRADIDLRAGVLPGQLNGLRVSSLSYQKPSKYERKGSAPVPSWIDNVKANLKPNLVRRLDQVDREILEDFHASSAQEKRKIQGPVNHQDSLSKQIPTASGQPILVAHPSALNNSLISRVSPPTSPRSTPDRPKTGETEDLKPKEPQVSELRQRPYSIEGRIQFRGGLAWIPHEMKLNIFRRIFGEKKEEAYIWESRAEFQIQVEGLLGQLIAELRDGSGRLIGFAELDLEEIAIPANHEAKLRHLQLNLREISSQSKLTTLSAHSYGGRDFKEEGVTASHSSPVVEVRTEGSELIPSNLVDQSISELILEKEGFIATRIRSQLKPDQRAIIFPEKFIQALLGLVLTPNQMGIDPDGALRGIIMGQVVGESSMPLGGAEIELAEHEGLQPIYFNSSFLPDPSLEKTSENGLYAFVDLKSGPYAIRARWNSEAFPAQVISVSDGVVTQVQFESAPRKRVTLDIADIFSGSKKVAGSVSIFGSDEIFAVKGQRASLLTSVTSQFQILEIEPQNNDIPVRHNFYPSKRHLTIPLINSDSLNKKLYDLKILQEESGLIYGKGPSRNYEVIIQSISDGQRLGRVLYGRSWSDLSQRSYGAKGDSFTVVGLSPGFYSVSIIPMDEEEIYSDVVFSEPGFANLVIDPRSADR